MTPSTRAKRTLAKKATKETVAEKTAPPKGKSTAKKDAKAKSVAKAKSRNKENGDCDHCAACGKGLAGNEGTVVNRKGDLEAVAKTGKEKPKADKAVAVANAYDGGEKGKNASKPAAAGKAKAKEVAEKKDKPTEKGRC